MVSSVLELIIVCGRCCPLQVVASAYIPLHEKRPFVYLFITTKCNQKFIHLASQTFGNLKVNFHLSVWKAIKCHLTPFVSTQKILRYNLTPFDIMERWLNVTNHLSGLKKCNNIPSEHVQRSFSLYYNTRGSSEPVSLIWHK